MLLTGKFFKKISAAAACLAVAGAVSGCASWRFQDNAPAKPVAPAASGAGPLGNISQSDLPPPEGSVPSAVSAADYSAGSAAAEPAGAMDLTPAGVAGVWRADLGGMKCQLATPQTKAGKGYRAGAIRCPAAFAQVGSWNINGKQLIFYDKSGNNLAVLYAVGANSFSGRTGAGMPVSLSR